jgi:hypothetical protein
MIWFNLSGIVLQIAGNGWQRVCLTFILYLNRPKMYYTDVNIISQWRLLLLWAAEKAQPGVVEVSMIHDVSRTWMNTRLL